MAACSTCGSTILFGGVRRGNHQFCNGNCLAKGHLILAAEQIPEGEVRDFALRVHSGPCPKCNGSGPTDVHYSYRVWSAFVLTQWQTRPLVGCRRCGASEQVKSFLVSLALGWWGIPWGLLVTPVQLGRNLHALLLPPSSAEPSPGLLRLCRLQLAGQGQRNAS